MTGRDNILRRHPDCTIERIVLDGKVVDALIKPCRARLIVLQRVAGLLYLPPPVMLRE